MTQYVDCACVIHGDLYPWRYVVNLYNMVHRFLGKEVRFHVFTEPSRPVPPPMIRHDLVDWPGIAGRKRAWWYKMQMFDPRHGLGSLLYFDLDVMIVKDITWITDLDLDYFWTLRDFKYLWRPNWQGANSSVMWWDTQKFHHIWYEFQKISMKTVTETWKGDQDYITHAVGPSKLRFLDSNQIRSWRWEILDGGMDFKTRRYQRPNAGAMIPADTSVVVFHGNPKPHEIDDAAVRSAWK